nr:uncharacterized protein LOC128695265 [Cherax quadricarinatus]
MERYLLPPSLLFLLLLLQGCLALWLGECNKPLGVSTDELHDSALTASSAHDHIVGPHRARLGMEGGGGAWCPRSAVDTRQEEWLEVDLGAPRLVTAVATQGRHANGQGVEYTPAYTLSYWRPGMATFAYYSVHPNLANKVSGPTLARPHKQVYQHLLDLTNKCTNTYGTLSSVSSYHLPAGTPSSVSSPTIFQMVHCLQCPLLPSSSWYTVFSILSYHLPDGTVFSVLSYHLPAGTPSSVSSPTIFQMVCQGHSSRQELIPLTIPTLDLPSPDLPSPDLPSPDFPSPTFPHQPSLTRPSLTRPSFTRLSLTRLSLNRPSFTKPSFTRSSFTRPSFTRPSLTNLPSPTFPHQTFPHQTFLHQTFLHQIFLHQTFPHQTFPHQPSLTRPSLIRPSLTRPSLTRPSFTRPSLIRPSLTKPSLIRPSLTRPSFTRPSLTNLPSPDLPSSDLPSPDPLTPYFASPTIPSLYSTSPSHTLPGNMEDIGGGGSWCGVGEWLRRRRGKTSSPRVFRRPPPDTLDMKSLMEGVGVGVNILGSTTPTYEEGSCLLYDDLQKTPLVTPYNTLRASTPDAAPVYSTPDAAPVYSISDSAPVYATPTALRPSSTFPCTSSFTPIPRPVTLASISRPHQTLSRPPPIPPTSEKCNTQIQVASVTGPWLTCVYRQDPGRLVTPTPTPTLAPERITRTGVLASGAFATLSVGVVSEDGSQEEGERAAPPTRHAALVTVTAHQAAPAATRHAQLLSSLDNENITRLLGVVVGGPVGVTLVLEYQPDAHLPEYLHARTLAPTEYAHAHATATHPGQHTGTVISVSGLVGVVVQVAAGMAFLESHRVSHTDLAARNIVVMGGSVGGHVGVVKVTQVGSALPRYSADYWRPPDGRGPAPLRWCSPETLCQGTFSSPADVWSFGVTLWEILTLARRRPHHHLCDDLLFHALLSTHAHAHPSTPVSDTYATPQVVLSPPGWCPREVQEVMTECWRPHPAQRPTFSSIHARLAAYALSHD